MVVHLLRNILVPKHAVVVQFAQWYLCCTFPQASVRWCRIWRCEQSDCNLAFTTRDCTAGFGSHRIAIKYQLFPLFLRKRYNFCTHNTLTPVFCTLEEIRAHVIVCSLSTNDWNRRGGTWRIDQECNWIRISQSHSEIAGANNPESQSKIA